MDREILKRALNRIKVEVEDKRRLAVRLEAEADGMEEAIQIIEECMEKASSEQSAMA